MSFRPLFALLLALLPAAAGAQDPPPGEPKKDAAPLLRFIVVSCPEDSGPLRIVTRADDDSWKTHAEFEPRPSFITEWLPVRAGELQLAPSGDGVPVPIGTLKFPAGCRRAIAVLFHDPAKKRYRADVIDPARAGFGKGSTLVVNYTSRTGAISLGAALQRIEPGARRVLKATPEANGMYRMLAAYTEGKNEPVYCYDRYVAADPDARDILLLLPDATLGMGVFRLSEFGPFE